MKKKIIVIITVFMLISIVFIISTIGKVQVIPILSKYLDSIIEKAIVLGNNSGFILISPVIDPLGTTSSTSGTQTAYVLNHTAPAGATTITEIGWWRSAGTSAYNCQVGLYDDNGASGSAGTLLNNQSGSISAGNGVWKNVSVNFPVTAGNSYWIAILVDTTSTEGVDITSSGGFGIDKDGVGAGKLENPWNGGAIGDADGLYAIYAKYISGTPDPKPIFSNYYDNNASQSDVGLARFNTTVIDTNGTVYLNILGNRYKASNYSASPSVFNVTMNLTQETTYPYNWTSYGNGTSHFLNVSNLRNYTFQMPKINYTLMLPSNNSVQQSYTVNLSVYANMSLSNNANISLLGICYSDVPSTEGYEAIACEEKIFNDVSIPKENYNAYFNWTETVVNSTIYWYAYSHTVFYSLDIDWSNDYSNLSKLSIGAADSCTYSGSGNWAITCSDNCVISSNVVGSGGTWSAVGLGRITLNANITNFNQYHINGGCNVTCANGCINY